MLLGQCCLSLSTVPIPTCSHNTADGAVSTQPLMLSHQPLLPDLCQQLFDGVLIVLLAHGASSTLCLQLRLQQGHSCSQLQNMYCIVMQKLLQSVRLKLLAQGAAGYACTRSTI